MISKINNAFTLAFIHFASMKFLTLIILCLLSLKLAAQHPVPIKPSSCDLPLKKRAKLTIEQVTLLDTFLLNQVNLLIEEESEQDSLFKKGLGYVELHYVNNFSEVFMEDAEKEHVIRSYYISPSLYSLKKDNELSYPPFYSYVGERLVFIYPFRLDNLLCYRYSKRSKRQLRRKLEPFLEKPKSQTFYGIDGKKSFRDKKFRVDYFKFHGGKYIYIFNDRPPKVIRDPHGKSGLH
jgi:hypothetical protein